MTTSRKRPVDPSGAEAARDAVIRQHTHTLKLPTVKREYAALAREARDGDLDYEDYLRELLEAEVRVRADRTAARRLREARFPEVKTLEQLDWKALSGVPRKTVMALGSCDFIERQENVVLAGPIGTGKTHLATAIGVEATRRRYRVLFTRAADLVRDLLEARDERALGRLHRRLQRTQLLIIDELGFVPFERAGGELLFGVFSDRYQRASTIVTTNLAFSEWVGVFGGDEKLTTALLDRLAHNAQILTTKGGSYRARRRKST